MLLSSAAVEILPLSTETCHTLCFATGASLNRAGISGYSLVCPAFAAAAPLVASTALHVQLMPALLL